jgi:hypothetical protein
MCSGGGAVSSGSPVVNLLEGVVIQIARRKCPGVHRMCLDGGVVSPGRAVVKILEGVVTPGEPVKKSLGTLYPLLPCLHFLLSYLRPIRAIHVFTLSSPPSLPLGVFVPFGGSPLSLPRAARPGTPVPVSLHPCGTRFRMLCC